MKQWSFPAALFTLSLCAASPALANGRFPRAQRLIEGAEPNQLLMVGTYGILSTTDRGKNWFHICEQAFAFGVFEGENPLLHLTADGKMFAGVYDSLNTSSDDGCSWTRALGAPAQSVPDLTVEGNTVLALLSISKEAGGYITQIQQSSDGGSTWEQLGQDLPIAIAFTLDSAPSDRNRLYVSGIDAEGQGVMLRSSNRGQDWESLPIPATNFTNAPYIAAVHPTEADIVYVRTDSFEDIDGTPWAKDSLLVTKDAGDGWETWLSQQGKLYGFAISPDAKTILLGFGDPNNVNQVDPAALGIYKLAADNSSLNRIFAGSVTCLTWTDEGVYACTSESEVGFELGFAENAEFSLETPNPLQPLLKLGEVRGPVQCCSPEAPNTVCQEQWAMTCAVLGACDASPNPGCGSDAGTGGTSGTGGTNGTGGTGLTDGAADAGNGLDASVGSPDGAVSTDAAVAESRRPPSSGCGCRITRGPSSSAFSLGSILGFMLLRLRRRRSPKGRLLGHRTRS